MSKKAKQPIKATETTFAVVNALMELDGAGVTELANYLDIPKSNAHNYLSTLRQEEYVVKDGDTYSVGIRFLELGAFARNRMDIYEIAKPEVEKLAEETGELANLLVEEHGRGIYLHRARVESAVQVEAYTGTRVSLHSTSLGQAILAHLPETRLDEIIDTHGLPASTDRTITTRDALENRLAKVRERGYATDDEERLKGLRCVAAPILSKDDRVLGAISVSGPKNRMKGDRFESDVPEKIRETVNVIELNVTYS